MKPYFYLLGLLVVGTTLFYSLGRKGNAVDGSLPSGFQSSAESRAPSTSEGQTTLPTRAPSVQPSGGIATDRSSSMSSEAKSEYSSDEETHRSDDLAFATKMYDSVFRPYHETFGTGDITVIGNVILSYGGYEGKYQVRFLLPSHNQKPRVAIPIYTAGISSPNSGFIGGGWLVQPDTRDHAVRVTDLGFVAHPMFKKKIYFDTLSLADRELDPNEIKGLVYTVDVSEKVGTSTVSGWLDFTAYEEGPPTVPIGKMEYVIRNGLLSPGND